MTGQDKKEIRQIFNEGIEQLILPHFESIDEGFEAIDKRFDAIDKRFKENQREHGDFANFIDTINRKLDSEIDWRDNASKRLKKVEVKLGFVK